jgi:hypothetical protein
MELAFQHKGETWQRLPATPARCFIVGLDLGQSQDPTALCVLEWHHVALDTWTPRRSNSNVLIQDTKDHFDIRHLERVPLGLPYPEIIAYVADVLAREPLRDNYTLCIDETGVGKVVGDLFDAGGLRPIKITITSGNDATRQSQRRWHVSKTVLISSLDARLNTGELRIAKRLTDASALAEEMRDFRRIVTDAGRATYGARVGKHDDLVLSVALATWWAAQSRRGGEVSTSYVRGMY